MRNFRLAGIESQKLKTAMSTAIANDRVCVAVDLDALRGRVWVWEMLSDHVRRVIV